MLMSVDGHDSPSVAACREPTPVILKSSIRNHRRTIDDSMVVISMALIVLRTTRATGLGGESTGIIKNPSQSWEGPSEE